MARVMVQAAGLRADVDALSNLWRLPLEKLPRNLMPPTMHLKVLISLESLAADLADVAIGF